MLELFDKFSFQCSKLATNLYSTSFSLASSLFSAESREAIYGIYGFVRLADEIVDTFHNFDKAELLRRFKQDTYMAIKEKISLNPILNSFQKVVHQYNIEQELIEAFLYSMELDLIKQTYTNTKELNEYIYGSAEVVGLMCLRVFCKGDNARYLELKPPAMKLGSAFQKINFLRDLADDSERLGRQYFASISSSDEVTQDKQVLYKQRRAELSKLIFAPLLKSDVKQPPPSGVPTSTSSVQSLTGALNESSLSLLSSKTKEVLSENSKLEIEADIAKDFADGLSGIRLLPKEAKLPVYLAYIYYWCLFQKIRSCSAEQVMKKRIRISDFRKILLMLYSYFRCGLNII
jgi:phytoene synthase